MTWNIFWKSSFSVVRRGISKATEVTAETTTDTNRTDMMYRA